MTENKLLLFSGGMDSFIAWYYLEKPPVLFVGMGHRHQKKEMVACFNLTKKMGVEMWTDDEPLGQYEEKNGYIPMKNLFLLMRGAFKSNHVCLVAQKGEQSMLNRTKGFFKQSSEMISVALGRNVVCDPVFPHMTKTEMVKWYIDQNLEVDLLKETVSCYSSIFGQCGQCASCFGRFVAFKNNLLEEKFHDQMLESWDRVTDYHAKAQQGTYYSDFRNKEILSALDLSGWKP